MLDALRQSEWAIGHFYFTRPNPTYQLMNPTLPHHSKAKSAA